MSVVDRQKLKDTLIGQLAKLPPTDQMWADIFESNANLKDPNTFEGAQTFKAAVDFEGVVTGAGGAMKIRFGIETPGNAEDIPGDTVDEEMTISKMRVVVKGSGSVTFAIHFALDRSAAGTKLIDAGTIATNETTGDTIIVFDNATIPINSWVWLETTAQSGVINFLNVILFG